MDSILLHFLISRLIITYDNNKGRKERKALKKLKTIALLVASCLLLTGCGCQKKETYTVSFDTAGGSTVSSIEVEEGQTATKPADPTRNGYTFEGWYNGDTEYTFTQKVTANTTLTAKWKAVDENSTTTPDTKPSNDEPAVKPTDNTPSLTLSRTKDIALTVGGSYTVKATTKNVTGSVEWTSSNESVATVKNGKITAAGIGSATITASVNGISKTVKVTVKAKSETVSYTVTFNSNGGSAVAAKTVKSGEKVSAPTAPTKDGVTFGGWYSDAALTKAYSFSSAVKSNITLYAKWTTNSYTFVNKGKPEGKIDQIVGIQVLDASGKDITSTVQELDDKNGNYLGEYYSDSKLVEVNANEVSKIAKVVIGGKTYDIKAK